MLYNTSSQKHFVLSNTHVGVFIGAQEFLEAPDTNRGWGFFPPVSGEDSGDLCARAGGRTQEAGRDRYKFGAVVICVFNNNGDHLLC